MAEKKPTAAGAPSDLPVVKKKKGKHLKITGIKAPLTAGKVYEVREKVAQDYIVKKIAKLTNPD